MGLAEELFVIFAAVAAVASGSVVVTGLVFPSLLLSSTKPFSVMVFFISLCDMIYSIAESFGFVHKSNILCGYQGFLFLFFGSAAWSWTAMLVFQLHSMIVRHEMTMSLFWIHIICWSLPCIPGLLPLSTNDYGIDDDYSGELPCTLSGNTASKWLWIIITFRGGLFWSILIMSISLFRVHWHFESASKSNEGVNARELALYNSMKMYPLAMFLTLIWTLIVVICIETTGHVYTLTRFALIVGTQYGTAIAVIFYCNSSALSRWKRLLFRNANSSVDKLTTRRSTSSSTFQDDDENLGDVVEVWDLNERAVKMEHDSIESHSISSSVNPLTDKDVEMRPSKCQDQSNSIAEYPAVSVADAIL